MDGNISPIMIFFILYVGGLLFVYEYRKKEELLGAKLDLMGFSGLIFIMIVLIVQKNTEPIETLAILATALIVVSIWYCRDASKHAAVSVIKKLKILFLFSCPRDTERLRLDEEKRVIRECFERAKLRERIDYETRHAVRVDDLRRAIIDEKPDIVHISGHGTGGTIVLEDEYGTSFRVPVLALGKYLSRKGLKCVVLNACETQALGHAISGVITIAMPQPISDRAAIEFAKGFYDIIGAGGSPRKAFDEGCANVELKNLAENFTAEYLEP